MKRTFTIVLLLCALQAAWAQEQTPFQNYGPTELISLKRDVPLTTALEILNGYCQRYDSRIIVDSKQRNQPIGVSVENMYWKRALEYILRTNMLRYSVHDRFYQIEDGVAAREDKAEPEIASITTREVEIDAVFFQADYETLRQVGVDWSTFKNGTVRVRSNFGVNDIGRDFLELSGAGRIAGTAIRVDALLKALESRNKGEVIAKPQIRVIDGKKGKIKVGKNFYLTLSDFAGNTRFTEYESGIILSVIPTVLGRNDSTFIYLDVLAERSNVQPDDIGVTKDITEGTTKVLLLNGEETVIAGLISHESVKIRKGVPILKDLPGWFFGLKYLFSSENNTTARKELVIFIQAKIVPSLLTRKLTRVNVPEHLNRDWRDLNESQNERGSNATRSTTKATRPTTRNN